MEAFNNLPHEKRERIINGAMRVFAEHGYHKTSAADIAFAAGISKAMIFTYFGSKYGCYEFMCDEMLRITFEEFRKYQEDLLAVSDFFDRVMLSARIKVDILKHCRPLLSFAASVFKEHDKEARTITQRILSEAYELREAFLSANIDSRKFKNPKDAGRIGKMSLWMSLGCLEEWQNCGPDGLERLLMEFIECMETLKNHFYKEEFLNDNS